MNTNLSHPAKNPNEIKPPSHPLSRASFISPSLSQVKE
jgi:hypothetical protein